MSYKVVELVRTRVLARPALKSMLLEMAFYVSDDGTGVWASVGRLAEGSGLGRTAAKDAIRDLNESGLIELVSYRHVKNGLTNEYRLNLTAIEALPANRLKKGKIHGREPTYTWSANDHAPGREPTPKGHRKGHRKVTTAEKEENLSVEKYAREEELHDHLKDNAEFLDFAVKMKQLGHG